MNLLEQIKAERRWYYKAQLIYCYHQLQEQEFGNKRGSGKWTMHDTSTALQLSTGYISESLKLVKHYDGKDLGQLTRDEALKSMKNGDK